jgi:beta-1,4-mannosyl-glycoprotein beta-1,4-N-acetylglucosaminyltransferase
LNPIYHHIEFDQNPLSINEIDKIIKDKVAIYDLSADQKENKIRGNKLEKYPLHKLPKYLQNNLEKYKEWID